MSADPHFSEVVFGLDRARGASREYHIHQLVADLFGDREDRGYLWREMGRGGSTARVLILSDQKPRQTLPTAAGGSVEAIRSRTFDIDLDRGTPLDFEIRINATRTVTHDGRKSRKDVWDAVFGANRQDPRGPADVYRAYLERKFEGASSLLEAKVVARGQLRIRRPGRSRPILVIATDVIGAIRVEDGDRLRSMIQGGIGRAKAFGCGLLLVSRPGTILPRRYRTDRPGS